MQAFVAKNKLPFSLLLTTVYFLLSLWGILHHEIWLDEAHSFDIARDSDSLMNLFWNTRQEGHPMIWYLLLWPLTKLSYEVIGMQLLHISITSFTIFLMARYAPFGKWKQLLFAFSYFFFYEYNIISRNYALCMLWVTIYCLLLCKTHRNYPLIAFVLLLLSSSHFIGLLLSIALAVVLLILLLHEEQSALYKKTWGLTLLILLIGYTIGVLQVLPQKESIFSQLEKPGYFAIERLRAFTVTFKAFYQFPNLWDAHPWNSNLFTANKTLGALLAFFFPFVLVKAFWKTPLSLLVIALSALCISLFFYTELMYNYTVRHWGFIFLAFYAAVWMQKGVNQKRYSEYLNQWFRPSIFTAYNHWFTQGLIYSTLLVQVTSAAHAYKLDLSKNFSSAPLTVQYIRQHHYENDLIVLTNFSSGPAVSAYLQKPMYYPEYNGYGSYGIWSTKVWHVSQEELLRQLHELNNHERAFLLLSENYLNPLNKNKKGEVVYHDETLQIIYLETFSKDIIIPDFMELYQINYLPLK
jgi:hypothetical protein